MKKSWLVSLFFILIIIASCDKKEPGNQIAHSGYIYMACDFGPYYLDFDLLVENCSVPHELADSLVKENIGQENSCLYDENPELFGSSEFHDIIFERENITINLVDFELTEINLFLDGQNLSTGEYPYYLGYNIKYEDTEVNVYMINKFIGGCFHDMILWERFE